MAEFPTGDAEETELADKKIDDLRACPKCAQQIPNTAPACPHCGQPLQVGNTAATISLVLVVLPFAIFLVFTLAGIILVYTDSYGRREEALFLFLGILFVGLSVLFTIPAIILGHRALSKIRKSPVPMKGRRLAIAGLKLSYSNVFLTPLAAIVIANMMFSQACMNESAASGFLRVINDAQMGYSAANGVYARSFAELTDATKGPAFLLGTWNNSVAKLGYIYTLKSIDNGNCYEAIASPTIPARIVGFRYFFTDCSCVIRANRNAPANSTSPAIDLFKPLPELKHWWRLRR